MNATDEAAAVLLRRSAIDLLRTVRASRANSPEQRADIVTPSLVGVVERNETLLRALVLDYATRVAKEVKFVVPPATAKVAAPVQEEVALVDLNKLDAEAAKKEMDKEGGPKH